MTTIMICADTPVPAFVDLYDQIVAELNIPNLEFVIPELPTLPSPIWPGIRKFSYEAVIAMAEIQAQQYATTFMAMIQPFVDFLGLAINDILPQIPVIGGTLIDLLAGNVDAMLETVKLAIAQGWETVAAFIPVPVFPNLRNLAEEALLTLQNIIRNYWNLLIAVCVDLIGQITDLLQLAGLPAIPVMPTVDELIDVLISLLPSLIPGLGDIMNNINYIAEVADKTISDARDAMGAIPSLVSEFKYLVTHPDVLLLRLGIDLDAPQQIIDDAIAQATALRDILTSITIPTVEELLNAIIPPPFPAFVLPNMSDIIDTFEQAFMEGFKNLINDMQNYIMNIIVDFVNDILSLLGITFPLICIPVVLPPIPSFPTIPTIPPIPDYPSPPDLPDLPTT